MKYDRDFLENVHNDIKADMAATAASLKTSFE